MPNNELLIQQLKRMIGIAEKSENYQDAMRKIQREGFEFRLFDEEFYHRLHRIDRNINALLNRPVAICRLASEDGSRVLEFMTVKGAADRARAIKHLGEILSGSVHLDICDPYFLKPDSSNSKSVLNYLSGLNDVIPKSIRSIDLFVKPGEKFRNNKVVDGFNNLCQDRQIKLSIRTTDDIHDRIWIGDCKRAYLVGTSFNGVGKQISFILELPDTDREDFVKELDKRR